MVENTLKSAVEAGASGFGFEIKASLEKGVKETKEHSRYKEAGEDKTTTVSWPVGHTYSVWQFRYEYCIVQIEPFKFPEIVLDRPELQEKWDAV